LSSKQNPALGRVCRMHAGRPIPACRMGRADGAARSNEMGPP
jgi:hypothetical protein